MPHRFSLALSRTPTAVWISVLALSSEVAPLAIDMYLPLFPKLTTDLRTTPSNVQLTLTAFLLGLAIGQLVIGPLSDSWGRRRLFLGGTAVCVLASLGCAIAPSIGVLIAARFVVGFAGGAGVVLGRAVVSDRTSGDRAAKLLSMMMAIQSVAPVVAPLLGGTLAGLIGWRGLFWLLTGLTAVMFVGVLLTIPESLPAARRGTAGLVPVVRDLASALGRRSYLGSTLCYGLTFAAMFAYIAGSPFVLQGTLGLSQEQYSLAFCVNAVGLVASSMLSARLLGTFTPRRLLICGVSVLVGCSAMLVAVVLVGAPLWPTLLLLFGSVAGVGFTLGNAAVLALAQVPDLAGTGSALLGVLQFGLGAAVSPLVGSSPLTMAVVMVIAATAAAGSFLFLARRDPDSVGRNQGLTSSHSTKVRSRAARPSA